MDTNLKYILSPHAVRERSRKLFEITEKGGGEFEFHPKKWDTVTDFVHQTILENYPNLKIPFHSRLGHFRAGNFDRLRDPNLLGHLPTGTEGTKMLIDLIIPSVLLDAGAGTSWKYHERETGLTLTRSEGLGVASFYLFLSKKLSSSGDIGTDAEGLLRLNEQVIEEAFQVTKQNPLIGVSGRLGLLQKLGLTILQNKVTFPQGRPSDLLDRFMNGSSAVDALKVLSTLLEILGPIWPSKLFLNGHPLGDTWSHPGLGAKGSFESLVPFHKLSQWLSYSILDACQFGDIPITNVEHLTGLPEYRNGGLFIDLGLITLKNEKYLDCGLPLDHKVIIEWRALTVSLLDDLAQRIQNKLNLTAKELPLAKILEGGTWWAGRKVAAQKRTDASSPIKILSDGTVF